MTVTIFMDENLATIKEMITNELPDKFNSHEFISRFAKRFELGYVTLLGNFEKERFRIVHSQLALSLGTNNEYFNIRKNGKVLDRSIFGKEVPNEQWVKIHK